MLGFGTLKRSEFFTSFVEASFAGWHSGMRKQLAKLHRMALFNSVLPEPNCQKTRIWPPKQQMPPFENVGFQLTHNWEGQRSLRNGRKFLEGNVQPRNAVNASGFQSQLAENLSLKTVGENVAGVFFSIYVPVLIVIYIWHWLYLHWFSQLKHQTDVQEPSRTLTKAQL